MQRGSWGNPQLTSFSRTFHVKSLLIWNEIFWSCFLCTIVQFADVLTNDYIVTLTRYFFLTAEVTLLRQPNAIHFKHVTSKVHLTKWSFLLMTLTSSVKYTNPGNQKHDSQPQLWIHSEVTVVGSCSTLIKYLSPKLTMLRWSCVLC